MSSRIKLALALDSVLDGFNSGKPDQVASRQNLEK